MIEFYEPECNGICVMGYEILEGGHGVAYPHPDCEKHGNPVLPDNYYEQYCENELPEFVDDDNPSGHCGGKVVSTGGQHHYNGQYNCYTMYLHCDRCGDYEVECV